jgi:sulfur carrier protein ThiS
MLIERQAAAYAMLSPLQTVVDASDFRPVPAGACIADLVPAGIHSGYVCEIDGEFVSRRDWWQPVREGDRLVVFRYVGPVHGGDSDPLRTVLQLAVIVAAAYVGGPAGAAIAIGGSLAINTLLPLPSQAGGFGNQGTASPTYSVALAGNRARLFQPIPVRFGQESYFPDEASQPYAEHDDESNQFYCVVLCLGYGPANVLRVELDDTDIRYLEGVSLAICGPGQTSRASPFQVFETLAEQTFVADNIVTAIEVGQQELITAAWCGAFSPTKPGKKLDRVFFDVVLPQGLANIDLEGGGDLQDRTVTLQFGARRIDDAGNPLESWKVVGTETLIDATQNPVRRSFGYDMPEGRYQFRIRRTLLKSDGADHLEQVIWSGLRARLNEVGCKRTDCTYVAVRLRANQQLSGGSQKRLRVFSQALVPVYDVDTETWGAPQFTRNPAHAAAYVLHDTTAGRGLPDSRIDHLTLADLAETFDERQDRFDYSFDTRRTVDEALQLIARAGRSACILRRGSVYTMVRDQLQSTPVALFMPRNMARDSFRMSFSLPTDETPDAVRMTYRDGRVAGDERVVWGQIHAGAVYAYGSDDDGTPQRPPGVPAPERVIDQSIAGVVGRTHALREVKFLVADAYMRRVNLSWQTELEGTLPAFGSLVGTAHDVANWGQSGDVAEYDAASRTLTASEPLTFGTGAHYVRLQTRTGGAGSAVQVTAGATAYEMVLATAPSEIPVFDDASRERTRYMFGSLSDVTRYAVVRALRRDGEIDVEVDAVLEVPDLHAVDADLLPADGEIQDPLPTATTIEEGDADFDPYIGAVVVLPGIEGGQLVNQAPAPIDLNIQGDIGLASVDPSVGDYSVTFGAETWFGVPNTIYLGFGSQPWTVEGKNKVTEYDGGGSVPFEPLVDFRRDQDEYAAIGILSDSPHRLIMRKDGEEFGSDAGVSIALDTPFEWAVTWDGNTARGFINGAMQWETTDSDVDFGSKRQLRVGRNYSGSLAYDGSNYRLRVTAGVCRYVDDYTVPATYPRS